MTIRVTTQEACRRLSELLERVRRSGDTVILEDSGKPMAAVVPLELYERLVAERDASFEVLDRIRARVPDLPMEEVEQDVAEAVNAVRNRAPEDR
jgi:prevent-host-death family protein